MTVALRSYLIIQYLLLGTVLLVHSKNQPSNRILAFTFFSIALDELLSIFVENQSLPGDLRFICSALHSVVDVLSAFLISTYVLRLINTPYHHYLFTPHILIISISLYAISSIPGTKNLGEFLSYLNRFIVLIYILVLLLYAFKKTHFNRIDPSTFNTQKSVKLRFVKIYLLFKIISITITSIIPTLIIFFDSTISMSLNELQQSVEQFARIPCETILILGISYVLLIKQEMWNDLQGKGNTDLNKTFYDAPRENKVPLPDEKYQSLVNCLTNQLQAQHIYLNPDISLVVLAESMGHKIHDLSYVINRHFGKNFNALMNDFRIEYAKKLLCSGKDNETIFQIALDSGFNTESVFYTTFKKITGHTPVEYKKKFQNKELKDSN